MISNYNNWISEKRKTKNSPDWHDSDAPDAKGKFRELGIRDLAEWLIKTRKGDMRRITGSLNQQIVFNRNDDPAYAKKMEKVREEVKRQLKKDESIMGFEEWISEDFAMVGVAPEGTLGGTMGNVVPPTSTSTGSGDAWPSLMDPASLAKLVKKKRKRRRKKTNENYDPDDLDLEFESMLLIDAEDSSVTIGDWIYQFDENYDSDVKHALTHFMHKKLREEFLSGKYDWKAVSYEGTYDGNDDNVSKLSEDDEAELDTLKEEGWTIFAEDIDGETPDDATFFYLLKKENSNMKRFSPYLKDLLKDGKNRKDISKVINLMTPEDANDIRGAIAGSKYNL
jgi:hypothetical protein